MGPEAGRTAGGGAAPLVRLALGGALLAAAAEGGGPLELMSAYTVVHFKRRHRQAPADKGGGVSGRVDEMVREMCRTRPDHPQCVAYARAEAPSTTTTAASAATSAAAVAAAATTPAATPRTTKAVAAFDCEAGRANWRDWWPHEKKVWCCEHAQTGCYEAAAPPPCGAAAASQVPRHRDGATATSDWRREYGTPESRPAKQDAAGCPPHAGGAPRAGSSGAARRGGRRRLACGAALLALLLGAGQTG